MTPDRLVDFIPSILREIHPPQMPQESGDAVAICQWLNRQQYTSSTPVPTGIRSPLWPQPPAVTACDDALAQAPNIPLLFLPAAPVRLCNFPGHNARGDLLPSLSNCQLAADHVVAANGELAFSRVDFEIPGPFTFRWQRNFRQSLDTDVGLGIGWRHSLCESLQLPQAGSENSHKVILHDSEGRIIAFDLPAIGHGCFNRSERLYLLRQSLHSFRISSFNQPDRIFRADGTGNTAPLCEIRDAFGNTLSVDYHEGVPQKIVTSWGRVLECNYEDGQLRSISNAQAGNDAPALCSYEYDENKNLVRASDETSWEDYKYQGEQLRGLQGQPAGQLAFEYDKIDRCHRVRQGSLEFRLQWQPARRRCTLSCDDLHSTLWQFDTRGDLVLEQQQARSKRYLYDHYRNLCQIIDADGQRRIFRYDEFGRLLRSTVNGNHHRYIYDNLGRLLAAGVIVATTVKNGDSHTQKSATARWQFRYEDHRHPVSISDPAGNHWACDYDERGQLRQLTDPEGGRLVLDWDAQSQLRALQRGELSISWNYDQQGNLTLRESNQQPLQRWEYSADGALCSAEIGTQKLCINRDELQRPCGITQEKHTLLQWQYDDRNQIRHVRFDNAPPWDLEYDPRGRLREMRTNEHIFHWQYDQFGQLEQFTPGGEQQREWQYDLCGRVTEFHDSDNHWYLQYSESGQLEEIRNNSGQFCRFHFDSFGRLLQAANNHSNQRFRYDSRNRLLAEHHDVNDGESLSINYEFDRRGWLKSSGSEHFNTAFTFSASGMLYGLDSNGQMVLRIECEEAQQTWNFGHNRVKKEYQCGDQTKISLGDANQWQPIAQGWQLPRPAVYFRSRGANGSVGTEQSARAFKNSEKLDLRGNIISEVRSQGDGDAQIPEISTATGKHQGLEYHYQYDGWGLLHSAECGDFKTYFRYDAFGRRLSKTSTHRRSRRQRRLTSHWSGLGLWSENAQLDGSNNRIHYLLHPQSALPLARLKDEAIANYSTTAPSQAQAEINPASRASIADSCPLQTQMEYYIADDFGHLLALLGAQGNLVWERQGGGENHSPGSFHGCAGLYDSETQLIYRDFSYWHAADASAPLDAGHDRLICLPQASLKKPATFGDSQLRALAPTAAVDPLT
ncbi:DUF6531 domain-containing protein [Microbulbifer sp. CAU 1566]|uniref:DUF6531 domain-containing protein n=1 Tax=Microbulbifer sp. CAU 1566 TaxID=2933269 RepID=UPI0020049C63|nr:DUF6531 domain-containing protein [Microbulbifer sp. CAU 1566]MCK7598863.1 DUF6531 domain-containing protein [Microbulbifer sp. CAU 1566]